MHLPLPSTAAVAAHAKSDPGDDVSKVAKDKYAKENLRSIPVGSVSSSTRASRSWASDRKRFPACAAFLDAVCASCEARDCAFSFILLRRLFMAEESKENGRVREEEGAQDALTFFAPLHTFSSSLCPTPTMSDSAAPSAAAGTSQAHAAEATPAETGVCELEARWRKETFPLSMPLSATLGDLKAVLYASTRVPDSRQKMMGLVKGKVRRCKTAQ